MKNYRLDAQSSWFPLASGGFFWHFNFIDDLPNSLNAEYGLLG
jgi:hypothetical protein